MPPSVGLGSAPYLNIIKENVGKFVIQAKDFSGGKTKHVPNIKMGNHFQLSQSGYCKRMRKYI